MVEFKGPRNVGGWLRGMKLKSYLKISTAAIVLAALGAGSVPAFAQESAASSDEAAPGDIVVTANRRDQSLRDVPMTIQAFGTDTLSELNITSINELIKYTPNVSFANNGPGNGAIFMLSLIHI
jgi:iron complex outermembrane receptor protein